MHAPPPGVAPTTSRARATRPGLALAAGLMLAVTAVPALDDGAARERDATRARTLARVSRALDAHHAATGELPDHLPDPLAGGWETSVDGHFLDVLVHAGALDVRPRDPRNDRAHHLLYRHYPAGTEGSPEPFYVLAVSALESDAAPGGPPAVLGDRDWSAEYPLAILGP